MRSLKFCLCSVEKHCVLSLWNKALCRVLVAQGEGETHGPDSQEDEVFCFPHSLKLVHNVDYTIATHTHAQCSNNHRLRHLDLQNTIINLSSV